MKAYSAGKSLATVGLSLLEPTMVFIALALTYIHNDKEVCYLLCDKDSPSCPTKRAPQKDNIQGCIEKFHGQFLYIIDFLDT